MSLLGASKSNGTRPYGTPESPRLVAVNALRTIASFLIRDRPPVRRVNSRLDVKSRLKPSATPSPSLQPPSAAALPRVIASWPW